MLSDVKWENFWVALCLGHKIRGKMYGRYNVDSGDILWCQEVPVVRWLVLNYCVSQCGRSGRCQVKSGRFQLIAEVKGCPKIYDI